MRIAQRGGGKFAATLIADLGLLPVKSSYSKVHSDPGFPKGQIAQPIVSPAKKLGATTRRRAKKG